MSLYNDIRPTTLEQVVGQDTIKQQLQGVISSGNIPNAFLLTGPRGTGKTTIARIIARTLNCEKGAATPCGECQSCKDILNGTSYDVIEMDAASNNKVEDVRGIIEKAQYAPMSKYKVFILDEVHMFSSGAWNALLKLIEEPPAGVVFILCTTEEHKVPATIISRCRKFYFQKIDLNVVAEYLAKVCDDYGKAYEDDALKLIAQASEGCMRDALSIMESFFDNDSLTTETVANTLGISNEEAVFGILNAISGADATTALEIVREQAKRGKNASLLVKSIISAITDTMFVLNGADPENMVNTAKYKQLIREYAEKTQMARCLNLAKSLGEVYGTLTKVPDALFLIESSLIRVIKVETTANAPIEKINELERRVSALEESGVSVVSIPDTPTSVSEVSNVVDFPTAEEPRIKGIELPVSVEENSSMDIGMDIPFEEDEFYIPDYDGGVPADFIPAEEMPPFDDIRGEEPPLVNTEVPTESTDENDDIFSHLPQGTTVSTPIVTNVVVPDNVSNDTAKMVEPSKTDTTNAVEPIVGREEPVIKADDSLSAVGFDGFADWL